MKTRRPELCWIAVMLAGFCGLAAAADLKHPDWHPGGEYLVAEGSCDGNADLYLVDLEAGLLTRLLGDGRSDGYPRWFADGRRIAFHRIDDKRDSVIAIAELDPGFRVLGISALTVGPFDIEPAPSPDGERLLFSTSGETGLDIAMLDLRTGKEIGRWQTRAAENFPSWHPDGRSILFYAREAETAAIWRRDLDSGELTRVELGPGPNLVGSFDSTGGRIVFNSERDGDREVYVRNLEDGSGRRLTDRPGRDGYPKFSPDGRSVAYHAVLDDGETVVRIQDLATGAERTFRCKDEDRRASAAF